MKLFQAKKKVVLSLFTIIVLSAFLYSRADASGKDFSVNQWPISTPESQGMRSGVLADMMAHIIDKSLHIDSITIVRNGVIVLDAYFWPFSKTDNHNIYSCTKSVMSALIGIAIDKGYIQSVHTPVMDFFPGKAIANMDDQKKSITLENLLMMTAGLKCQDSYLYGWEGLIEMRGSHDWAQYVLSLPMAEPPGKKFEYCNGVSYLLSEIIRNTTKMNTLEFAKKYLFEPLGISEVVWDTSPKGVYIGWGEMRLKPHDMAKLGWLFLNKGRWGNRQILPSEWVQISTQGHIEASLFDHYGYQWWVDAAGYYMAVGFKGQRIFIVPDKNIVAVFTGDLTGRDSLMAKKILDNYIIPAASSTEVLPSNPKNRAQLNALVKSVAKRPPPEITWLSANEGVAKDGVFTREVPPAFTLSYPFGCRKSGLVSRGQIMRMKTLSDVDFSAFVMDIREGVLLQEFGLHYYTQWLEYEGKNVNVIRHEEVTLKCGTKAYRTDISWVWQNSVPLTTLLDRLQRKQNGFRFCSHVEKSYSIEPIVMSLYFHN